MTVDKAVVLKYLREAGVPFVVAKGKGEKAAQIIELARKYKVPVTQDEVVHALAEVNEGEPVDEAFYQVLAEIFAVLLEEIEVKKE